MSKQRFQDQVFIITGGGTGIGKQIAQAVLAEGGNVVINGRREAVLAETAKALDPSGARVRFLAGSIAEADTARGLVGLAKSAFGRVDVLVNNAGVFKPTPFLEHDEQEFTRYVDIILKGSFFAAQAAIGEMVKQGSGTVVNVGSMWADHAVGATPSSAYSAAKAGVHALTRNLAIEFADKGIRVNAVAPAVVETPVYDTFMSPEQKRDVLPTFNQFHPIGRNGQPADVSAAVLFLASAEAGWITGAVLPVDGGVTAGRG